MFGERLRQARLLAGLTQQALADALTAAGYPVTKAGVSKYEKNGSTPPAAFLMLAAQVTHVPTSYFTHQPSAEVTWLAFRRHSTLPDKVQETVRAYAADVAELHIALHTLLYPEERVDLPTAMRVMTMEDAERAANALRTHWKLDDAPIESLVQTAESGQVVVVGWEDRTGEFDGLAGWCGRHPITVISTAVDADRRRFTLAHELGHLVMDTSAVTDEKHSEHLAHRFAAALLVPADCARRELGTRRTSLSWDELGILKRRYGLSMSAWIMRARDLNIITARHAKTLFQEMSARGWRTREPVRIIADETPLRLDQMAHRAVEEGLISPDRVRRAFPQWKENALPINRESHLTVYDLMAMPQENRERVMAEAFALAAEDNFETFDAFDDMDFDDDAF